MNTTFGRYRLLELLGQGGMAEVFKAKSFGVEGFEKILVIKRILPELAKSQEFVDMFIHEAKLAVRLSHANIVQVFDLGRASGGDVFSLGTRQADAYYMAMEYVHGFDLATLLGRLRRGGGVLPIGLATYIASEIAKGLDHAHRRRDEQHKPLGIVHRDVSPQNVLLSFEGEVKVTDFGIAKARGVLEHDDTNRGPLRGKVGYMSPEQARGATVDARADLFSLGILLYECTTGAHPFEAPTREETLRRVLAGEYPPPELVRPEVPNELVTILRRALAKDPSDRFPDAGQMYEAMLSFLYGSGIRTGANDLAEHMRSVREDEPPAANISGQALASDPASQNERTPVEIPSARRPSVTTPPPPNIFTAENTARLGERRDATALFVEVGGNADAANEAYDLGRAVVERYGGLPLAREDAGIFALFGLGDPDGRDTELATRAALVAMRVLARFRPSAGVHCARINVALRGIPVEDERLRTLLGTARELARAQVGSCVVSAAAERQIRRTFECEAFARGAREEQGRENGLLGSVVTRVRNPHETYGRFVGRREELRIIGEVIALATKRRAQVLTLRGDQGIGKTRLICEVERRLGKGNYSVGLCRAECPPLGKELALSGITCMLHALCGLGDGEPAERILEVQPRLRALGLHAEDVGAILGALGAKSQQANLEARTALKNAFGRMVARLAEDQPYVLVWDAAHWLDDESMTLLESIFARSSTVRVVFAFVGRAGFSHLLASIEGHTTIELSDLRKEEAEALVRERLQVSAVPAELVRFVHDRAAGHPQFIEEILRALLDAGAVSVADGAVLSTRLLGQELALPRTLRGLVASRVAKQNPSERILLQASAVLGLRAEAPVLAFMLGESVEVVERTASGLERSELLAHLSADELGFLSPVVREAVLDMLTSAAATQLHGAAALALERTLGARANEQAGRIALHLFQAGERSRASGYFGESGKIRLAGGQFELAAHDFERAIELANIGEGSGQKLGEWLSGLSQAVRLVRVCSDVDVLVAKVLECVDREADVGGRLAARIDASVLYSSLHRFEPARSTLLDAERVAEGDERLAKRVLFAYAELATRQGDFNRAIAMLQRLQQIATHEGDQAEEQRVLFNQAHAHAVLGDRRAALAAIARTERLFPDDEAAAYERQKLRALVEYYSCGFRAALEEGERALELARKFALPYEVALNLHTLGDVLIRLEDFPRAYGMLRQSTELCDEGTFERLANHNRMLLAFLDGVAGEHSAERLLRQGITYAEANDYTSDALSGRYLLATLLLRRGFSDQALDEFETTLELAQDTGNHLVTDECREKVSTITAQMSEGT